VPPSIAVQKNAVAHVREKQETLSVHNDFYAEDACLSLTMWVSATIVCQQRELTRDFV